MKKSASILSSMALAVVLSVGTPELHAASPALTLARQLNEAFVEVAQLVAPSVVVIKVVQKPGVADESSNQWLELLPPDIKKELETRPPGKRKATGEGSGVIFREDGYILTNNHVVENPEKIKVKLQNGEEFDAEVRGTDPSSDLAVIKIKNPPKGLKVAKFADSDQVRVGEFAIALGAPYELEASVTFGHVSAKGRSGVDFRMGDQDFIQTDASINPGNSGGPLVNIDGEVMGINSMIRGLNTGIAFAIPSNLAKEIGNKIVAHGKVQRPWLGIGIDSLRDSERTGVKDIREMTTSISDGVVVLSINEDGPSVGTDLKAADIIVAVDGKKVSTPQQLRNEVRQKDLDATVLLDVVRNNKNIKVKIALAPMPETVTMASTRRRSVPVEEHTVEMGMKLKPMSKELSKSMKLDTDAAGVVVTEVERGSIAEQNGFQPGDIITEANREPVTTPKELREAIKGKSLKDGIIFNYERDGNSGFRVMKERGE